MKKWVWLAVAAVIVLMISAGVAEHRVKETADGIRCVVIDPGHGGFDGGAEGIDGLVESELNLAVALEMQKIFSENGYRVVLTREDESAIGADKSADMQARAKRILAEKPDLVLSVHMNRFSMASAKGPQVFYQTGAVEAQVLAQCLQNRLNALIPESWKARSAKAENYFILKAGQQPSALIECGFVSNPEEAKLLSEAVYRKELAQAVFQGTEDYFAAKTAMSEDMN